MSIPALRRPKTLIETKESKVFDHQYLILTLKNGMKLVITSDTFHGIIKVGHVYKCVVCDKKMLSLKDSHKEMLEHRKLLSTFPFNKELFENLVRQIDKLNCYCTICNVITATVSIRRHIQSEAHIDELNKAIRRAKVYKPVDDNNN